MSWRDIGLAAGAELGSGLSEAFLSAADEAYSAAEADHAARMAALDRETERILREIDSMPAESTPTKSAGLTPEAIRRAYDRG